MPKSNRNIYPVVTSTIVAIAIASVAIRAAKPFLPPDPANRLKDEPADFLQQGAYQQVDWRIYSEEAFREAKERRKPILLLIGAAWSALGRLADKEVFTDPDVEALLRRDFVCIRIDAQDQPQWFSAILPLRRARDIRDPGFQLYALDPDGQVFDDFGRIGFGPPLNATELSNALLGILNKFEAYRNNEPDATIPGESQHDQENRLLANSPNVGIDYSAQRQATLDQISGQGRGFHQNGFATLHPSALRYLLRTGEIDAFQLATTPAVTGGLVDWLDGGFFDQVQFDGRRETEFDKRTLPNAEMMEVFAEAYSLFREPIYRELAQRTFRFLVDEMSPDLIPLVARVGDEVPGGRSGRSSITVRQLRESVDAADLEFARDVMGLRSETNPMMTIRMPDPSKGIAEIERFNKIVAEIRAHRPVPPRRIGPQSCGTASFVCARLIRTAQLLDDPKMKSSADSIWRAIQAFASGNDVRRKLELQTPEEPILADFLGFADACLQRYMATGDDSAARMGIRILDRAAFLFCDSPGVWKSTLEQPKAIGMQISPLPELLDTTRESETAMVIRINFGYSKVLAKLGIKAEAYSCRIRAFEARDHFADDSSDIAFSGSGFFCASLELDRG